MLEKFIHLDQTSEQFPLMDTSLYFVNPQMILNTSTCREKILLSVTPKLKDELLFGLHMHPGGVYPRFNRNHSNFKLSPSPIYSFLPNLVNFKNLSFDDVTDNRALELQDKVSSFNKVYLFWSGGIDSTVILAAILKNWNKESIQKLIIVLNKYSVEENSNMYHNYIHEKINTISTDLFFSGKANFSHDAVYVDGNVGDSVSYLCLAEFDKMYPGYYKKPWKQNWRILIEFFSKYQNQQYGLSMYKQIVESLEFNNLEIETINDFLWWLTFNWLHDKLLYNILWQYTPCFFSNPNIDTKKFLEENMFQWFNSDDYQNWTVSTIGTTLRIGDDISTNKYSFKTYIFNFDNNYDYYKYKLKEASTPKNIVKDNHIILCAIDTEYNYYYRYTHEKTWPPKNEHTEKTSR